MRSKYISRRGQKYLSFLLSSRLTYTILKHREETEHPRSLLSLQTLKSDEVQTADVALVVESLPSPREVEVVDSVPSITGV